MPSIRSAALTTADATATWTAIVLAGGSGTRLGGRRKAEIMLGEATLLEHVLRGLPAAIDVIVVGPAPSAPSRTVIVTRESPAGGGPVAALAAGLELVRTAIAHPFVLDGQRLPVSASIGAAIYPRDGLDAAALARVADADMYRAKRDARMRVSNGAPVLPDCTSGDSAPK